MVSRQLHHFHLHVSQEYQACYQGVTHVEPGYVEDQRAGEAKKRNDSNFAKTNLNLTTGPFNRGIKPDFAHSNVTRREERTEAETADVNGRRSERKVH